MAKYSSTVSNVTLNTFNAFRGFQTNTANNPGSIVKIYEISLSGENGSSTVNRIGVNRATSLGTSSMTQVPEKLSNTIPAGGATVITAYSVEPAQGTNDVLLPTFNGFGGVYRWVAPPDSELLVAANGATANNIIFRPRAGNTVVSGHVLFEEP